MSHKSPGKLKRLILAFMCIWVALIAVLALFIENWLGWFLFFSPGWANDAFGMRFQTVLSVGMTVYILLVLTTAAAGFAAIVGFICTLLRIEWEHVGRDYRIWFWFAAMCLCLGAALFLCVYFYFWRMFPDGYIRP
jgi:hypothetical protein